MRADPGAGTMMRGRLILPVDDARLVAVTAPTASYPELTGMFSHGTGRLEDAAGHAMALYAWGHDDEPAGTSRLYWNTNTSYWFDYKTGWYERFAVVGDWVRFMGQASWTDGDPARELYVRVESEGQAGQRYAKVQATEPYTFAIEAEYIAPDAQRLTYFDSQTWAPTPAGWVQQEMFRYPAPWNDLPGFQSVVSFEPGRMFAAVDQVFVNGAGVATHGPVLSNTVWGSW